MSDALKIPQRITEVVQQRFSKLEAERDYSESERARLSAKIREELEPELAQEKATSAHWRHLAGKLRGALIERLESAERLSGDPRAPFPSWVEAAQVLIADPEGSRAAQEWADVIAQRDALASLLPLLLHCLEGLNIYGGDVQDALVKAGILRAELFDAEKHGQLSACADFEDGDIIYLLTDSGVALVEIGKGKADQRRSRESERCMIIPPDIFDDYAIDGDQGQDYDDGWPDEDDDPIGCCCPDRCLNLEFHHRMSECYTAEDLQYMWENPSRWEAMRATIASWFWFIVRGVWSRCSQCKRLDYVCWVRVGDHSEHIPF